MAYEIHWEFWRIYFKVSGELEKFQFFLVRTFQFKIESKSKLLHLSNQNWFMFNLSKNRDHWPLPKGLLQRLINTCAHLMSVIILKYSQATYMEKKLLSSSEIYGEIFSRRQDFLFSLSFIFMRFDSSRIGIGGSMTTL